MVALGCRHYPVYRNRPNPLVLDREKEEIERFEIV